jgi:hypothetical protein
MAAVRERLRQYAASHPHPATPRSVAGVAQAVKVAAPAPALGAGGACGNRAGGAAYGCCTTGVTCHGCRSSFSGYCLGGFCNYVSGFSCDCITRNSGIRGVSGGKLRNPLLGPRGVRQEPSGRTKLERAKANRRKMNQDPVKTPPDM